MRCGRDARARVARSYPPLLLVEQPKNDLAYHAYTRSSINDILSADEHLISGHGREDVVYAFREAKNFVERNFYPL